MAHKPMGPKKTGKLLPQSKVEYTWTVITDEVVANLEAAFRLGVTDDVACRHANIDRATYYRALKRDEVFATRMAKAKDFPRMVAGKVVMDDIVQNSDVESAKWWLGKKYGDEFKGTPLELNQTNQTFNLVTDHEELAERLARLFGQTASQRAIAEGEVAK